MATLHENSLTIRPAVEASLKDRPQNCLYVARLVDEAGARYCLRYPSGLETSLVNIGEGESFIDRWLANDKAEHTHKLQKLLDSYDFRIEVDVFSLEPGSDRHAIERMLERCFMAAYQCPPFFQEVRGKEKLGSEDMETWLFKSIYDTISCTPPTSTDFATINEHVRPLLCPVGKKRWKAFQHSASDFFNACDSSHEYVGISFDTARNEAFDLFGGNVVKGMLARLPTGTSTDINNPEKHRSKVKCYKIVESLAQELSLPPPATLKVGAQGDHGELSRDSSTDGGFVFRRDGEKDIPLNDAGEPRWWEAIRTQLSQLKELGPKS